MAGRVGGLTGNKAKLSPIKHELELGMSLVKLSVSGSNFNTIKQRFQSMPQYEHKSWDQQSHMGKHLDRKEGAFPCGTRKKHGILIQR